MFLVILLKQCSSTRHLHQIHGFMLTRSLYQDNILFSRFIEACSELGFLNYGFSAFRCRIATTQAQGPQPNIYLYNTMIKCLSIHQHSAKEAICLYKEARFSGLRPDSYSFPFVLKAVVRLFAIEVGRQIHCQVFRTGLGGDTYVGKALVEVYLACRGVSDALRLFEEMPVRDVLLWNAMVAGYAKLGYVDAARDLFDRMPERNVISWTLMIAGYVQVNRPEESIILFQRMLIEGVQPDNIAMLAVVSACAHLGALKMGEWIHDYINRHALRKSISLDNALVYMYAKSGNIVKAIEVFENIKQKNIITWTTMIAGLAFHGFGKEALQVFSRMEMTPIKPNEITFIAVLSACSHVGLVEIGRWFFNRMDMKYGIKPQIEHYGCMIDLLGRAGFLQEAGKLVRRMPFEANSAIWGSLLAASRIHGDVELGKRAWQHLLTLEPDNSGNYSLLSNIYASKGQWSEAGMMRKVMRDRGVKKKPGGSYIEVYSKIHEFHAENSSHSESENVFRALSLIDGQIRIAGYLESEFWY